MNDDMMIDTRNGLDNMMDGFAHKYKQMSYNVDNNNQYGKQFEEETTKSTKASSPQNKW